MSRRFLKRNGGFFVVPIPVRHLNPHQKAKGTDEHNNPKQHDKEDNPLYTGAQHAVVCGENQNKACP